MCALSISQFSGCCYITGIEDIEFVNIEYKIIFVGGADFVSA